MKNFYSLEEVLKFNNSFFFLVDLKESLYPYPGIEPYLPPRYLKIYYQLKIFLYGETYEFRDLKLADQIEKGLITSISGLKYNWENLYYFLYYPKEKRENLLDSHLKILLKLEEKYLTKSDPEIKKLIEKIKNKEITSLRPEIIKKEEHFLLQLWSSLHEEKSLPFYQELTYYLVGESLFGIFYLLQC